MNAEIALPQGFALNEYRIESTLGVGGFGVTYLATDSNLNLKVAIKEYLPGDLALRCEDQSIKPKSDSSLDTFNWGRSRFLDESRTLASFHHPNIVRVMRFFEANQTAYMVMEFVAGKALNEWIRTYRPLPEQLLIRMTIALLDGLEVIHRAGYLHRDIKPGNIFIREDATPVLLDFGSARVANADTELTAIVSPGYAPFEQYHSQGNQGPWSDLYAVGAVLYWIVTGEKPVEAAARVRKDVMTPAVRSVNASIYSAELLKAIDWALSPAEEARPQSVVEFRNVLQRLAPVPASEQATVLVTPQQADNAAGPSFGPATTAVFDRETLKKIETELAPHIGPIAAVLVRSAAKKAFTIAQLAELIAVDIPDEKLRAAFVKKFSSDKSTPTGPPARSSKTAFPPTQAIGAQPALEPAILTRAEAALAQHIGAIAKVVVKRAAAKARDESALYQIIAEAIDDKAERKAFIRKAMSVSGKE